MDNATVTIRLNDFDQLRDGLEIAVDLLQKIDEGEFYLTLELAKEVEQFLERFK